MLIFSYLVFIFINCHSGQNSFKGRTHQLLNCFCDCPMPVAYGAFGVILHQKLSPRPCFQLKAVKIVTVLKEDLGYKICKGPAYRVAKKFFQYNLTDSQKHFLKYNVYRNINWFISMARIISSKLQWMEETIVPPGHFSCWICLSKPRLWSPLVTPRWTLGLFDLSCSAYMKTFATKLRSPESLFSIIRLISWCT